MLADGMSVVVRLLDAQREGHLTQPFAADRFNPVYMPPDEGDKLNFAYTSSTEQRLLTTPRIS